MTHLTSADPFELTVAADERFEQIKLALLAMSHREQLVVIAHDSEARPLGWIAERLSISLAEVTNALADARSRLAEIPGC